MTIYLIRHGETDWNAQGRIQGREDIPLNAAGRAQAARCGSALRGRGIEAVAVSPLGRAMETGRIVADAVGGVPVFVEDGLIERNLGSWSGQVFRDIFHPDVPVVGAEPVDETGTRMEAAVRRCAAGYGDALAVVSHGGAINALLRRLSNGAYGSGITRLKNACITVVTGVPGPLHVQAYNLTAEEFQARFGEKNG